MHEYSEIAGIANSIITNTIEEREEVVLQELQSSAKTLYVKILQALNLQRAIQVVGSFAIFESMLQQALSTEAGFLEAKKILKDKGEDKLVNRLTEWIKVVNTLKHGFGPSYESLVNNSTSPESKLNVKQPDQNLEGDVSEISTQVQIDIQHIEYTSRLIYDVSRALDLSY